MNNITKSNGTTIAIESLTSAMIIFFSCLGVISNGMVCYIVYSRKNIRQPLNCLLANLALSDLIHSFMIGFKFAFPLIVYSLPQRYNGLSSEVINTICNFVLLIVVIAISNSMWSLAIISLERCRVILYPMKFSDTKRKMVLIFIFTWAAALICGTLLVVGREYDNSGQIDCSGTLTTQGNTPNAILTTVYTSIAIIIPFIIMTVCYSIIVIKLCDKSVPMDDSQYKNKIQKFEQKKTICIVSLMIITVVTSVAGGPYSMLYNWLAFQKANDHLFLQKMSRTFWTFFHLCAIFTLIPDILNPLLYNFASSTFRKEVKKTFQSLGFRLRSPVSFLQSRKTDSTSKI